MKIFNKITQNKTPIIVTSHPRSGTHLTIDLIRRQFPETIIKKRWGSNKLSYLSLGNFNTIDKTKRMKEEDALQLIASSPYPIIKLHTYGWSNIIKEYPHWMHWFREKGKVIYVARDIRQVIPSMHKYEQSFNPQARCCIKDFIKQPYLYAENRVKYWNQEILQWYDHPNYLSLRFEDIIFHPKETCNKLASHLQLQPKLSKPILPKNITNIWHARLQRILSTNPTSTAIVAQKSNNWINTLDQEDLDFIYHNSHEAIKKLNYNWKKDNTINHLQQLPTSPPSPRGNLSNDLST